MKFFHFSVLLLGCLIATMSVNGQNEKLTSVYSRSNYFEGDLASSLKSKYKYDIEGNLIEEIQYSTFVDSPSFQTIKRKELDYTSSGMIKEERNFTSYNSPERLGNIVEYNYLNETLTSKEEYYYDREGIPISEVLSYYNMGTGKLDSTITVWLPPYQWGRKEVFNYMDLRTEISVYHLYEDDWLLYNVEVKIYNQLNQLELYFFKYDDWSAELLYEYEYDMNGRVETFKSKREIYGTNEYELSYQSDCENIYGNDDRIIEIDCFNNHFSGGSIIYSDNVNTQFEYYCDGPLRKKIIFLGRNFEREEIYNYDKSYECLPNTELDLKLYPNPSSNLLFLESESFGYKYALYGVYDITGKEVVGLDHNLRDNLIEIDVSSFSNGIYVIRLFDGLNIKSIKFMKM